MLLMAWVCGHAQEVPAGMQEQFKAYHQNIPQEKLFVHTDKNFYLTGETIWFRIYHVDAGTHKPTGLSKVAYVELLDHESKPLLQVKIGLGDRNGNGIGALLLPAYLSSGTYQVRAYTSWMKNFDKAYFFQKTISLVNTSRRPDWPALEKREAYTVKFFPEGGNLVYGLESRVAFQITDQYGKGADGEVVIMDQRNDTASRGLPVYKTSKFGIGRFNFLPRAGSDYKVLVNLSNGRTISATLPQIFRQGHVMRVADAGGGQLKVTVSSTDADKAVPVYLLIHSRQQIKAALAKNLNNGNAGWTIPKSSLGEGVSVLTLFNEARQPVCERLWFERPLSKMNIAVKTDQQEYGTRSKVTLDVNTQNEKNEIVRGDLSVSVFMIDSLQTPGMQNIENYLWLTSDLAGKVESPEYYFGERSPEVDDATDNLMLTHGWRRFRWEEVATGRRPAFDFLPEYEGMTVQTRVVDKATGNPGRGVMSYISFVDERFQVSNAVSNEKGMSAFVTRDIFGQQELVLQTDSNSNRYRIDVLDPFAPVTDSLVLPKFTLPETWREQLSAHHLNTALANSYQPLQVRQFLLPASYDTSLFYGKPDRRFYLDDFTRFPSMEEVMREYVDAVRIRRDGRGYYFEVMNLPAQLHFNAPPLVLVDGVPVFNLEKLIAFDPLKVKKIDVIGRKYYWGNLTCNGIVSYSTYDGDLGGFELDPAALVVEFQGLQLQREFYSPAYDTPEKKDSRVPDARNVLFWQPNLTAGPRTNSRSIFYTSDIPGIYVIVVQGISEQGVPGSKVVRIVVK